MRRNKGSGSASGSEVAVTRAGALQSGVALSTGNIKFDLPTLGPPAPPQTRTNPLLGYVYRDNETFAENFDKVEAIVSFLRLSIPCSHSIYDNPSGALANSAVKDMNDTLWSNIYTYLHEMAQKRDGYRSTDYALNTALDLIYRDNLIIAAKINIRVLAQLYSATLVNEATLSTQPGFRSMRSRILRDLEVSNRLVYPQAWDDFILFWSQVYAPYPGGPLIANFFTLDDYIKAGGLLAPSASGGTATIWAALPDLTSAVDVAALLNDIEVAFAVVERFQANVANTASDLRNIASIYAMMGFPTPQTPLPRVDVSPDKFHAQFQRYGWLYNDTKGAGADTHLFWPDIRGVVDSLINVDFGPYEPDILDYIGAKGRMGYAYDADEDDTPGYTAEANNLTCFGLVCGSNWLTASLRPDVPACMVYTREDTWVTLARELDYTSAAGVQAHIWSIPDMLAHPEFWRAIMSEEAEEAYLHRLLNGQSRPVQIPFDHFGQSLRKWIYAAYKIPYIT